MRLSHSRLLSQDGQVQSRRQTLDCRQTRLNIGFGSQSDTTEVSVCCSEVPPESRRATWIYISYTLRKDRWIDANFAKFTDKNSMVEQQLGYVNHLSR